MRRVLLTALGCCALCALCGCASWGDWFGVSAAKGAIPKPASGDGPLLAILAILTYGCCAFAAVTAIASIWIHIVPTKVSGRAFLIGLGCGVCHWFFKTYLWVIAIAGGLGLAAVCAIVGVTLWRAYISRKTGQRVGHTGKKAVRQLVPFLGAEPKKRNVAR